MPDDKNVAQGVGSVKLVTSESHLPRSRYLFEATFAALAASEGVSRCIALHTRSAMPGADIAYAPRTPLPTLGGSPCTNSSPCGRTRDSS
eukprot:130814-Rhodomonas_salina.1